MKIGNRIRKLRKRLGLTQKEFAGCVPGKIDYTYIGKMERDQQYPSIKMLQKIGMAFSVPLSYFFEDDDFLNSSKLLPIDIKDLLKDTRKQDLLRTTQTLNTQDLDLVMQIINILTQKKPLEGLQLAESPLEYPDIEDKKKKDLTDTV
ncbi:MAG: helix-turn-helix domain-containing protein [Clostridia bacterium]|nr:helix-turn-helix domain-containing protein [Clostridia bacterium]